MTHTSFAKLLIKKETEESVPNESVPKACKVFSCNLYYSETGAWWPSGVSRKEVKPAPLSPALKLSPEEMFWGVSNAEFLLQVASSHVGNRRGQWMRLCASHSPGSVKWLKDRKKGEKRATKQRVQRDGANQHEGGVGRSRSALTCRHNSSF